MNKFFIPIAVILLSIFNGCNSNLIGPDTADTYFPLSKGNTWYYKDYRVPYNSDTIIFTNPTKEYDITYEVIGEKIINRKRYSMIEERYFLTTNTTSDTAYYRIEGENLYMFRKAWSSDQYLGGLYAKFSVSEGDTFHCTLPDYEYIATVVKKSSTIAKFHYLIPGGADEEFELTFHKNIGIVRIYSTDWGMGIVLSKHEFR